MHLLFEPPPIYFMHIPKTGGVSLGQWLRSAYGRGYFDLDLPQIVGLTGRDVKSFRCYHAWHHGHSMFDWLDRPDLVVITMLREPTERLVSSFEYRQRMLAHHPDQFKVNYQQEMRRLCGSEIHQWLDDEFLTHKLSNGQVRVLGIRQNYQAFFSSIAQSGRADALLRPYDVPLIVDLDNQPLLLANAHTWLDEMAVVGLTERYAESLLLIADLLGVPVPATPVRANVNPGRTSPTMRYRDNLPPAVVAQLEELNCYDLELYAHATELFEQQWARYQARSRRTYSIAAHLRVPVKRAKSGLKTRLRRAWPGLAARVRQMRSRRSRHPMNPQEHTP